MAEHLRGLGYQPRIVGSIRRADRSPLGTDLVRVTVGRFVATVAGCPDWRYPSAAGSKNQPSSNLGCADAKNFAAQLADPADLVLGRGGPSRSAAEVLRSDRDRQAADQYVRPIGAAVVMAPGQPSAEPAAPDAEGAADPFATTTEK